MVRHMLSPIVIAAACGAACSAAGTRGVLPATDGGDSPLPPPVDAASPSDGSVSDGTTDPADASDASMEGSSDAGTENDSRTDSSLPGPYTTALIGYWPFDGSGTDVAGNARSLTLVGAPTFGSGRFGNALALNGTGNQYAVRPVNDAAFDFGASDFTVSIWVRFNAVTPEQNLVEKFDGQVGPGWTFIKLGTGQAHFWGKPSAILNSNPLVLQALVWHHFLARRSGSDFAIFVDGVTVSTGTSALPIPSTNMPLLVGRRNANDGRVFGVDGLLDDLAIWARALTDTEVAGLWMGGTGRAVLP